MRFLRRWIQKAFPDLDAPMVVRHKGYDNMLWESRCYQYERTKNFSEGSSRLIVTTSVLEEEIPAGIYLFKVNNRNTSTRCEI